MPKGTICCCGARTWSRIIGWIDLFNAIFKFFPLCATLLAHASWKEHGSEVVFTVMKTLGIDHYVNSDDTDRMYLIGWMLAFLAFLQIPFAIILLVGSYKARPSFLKFWIVTFAPILTALAMMGIIHVVVYNKGVMIFQGVMVILVGVIIEGFCIWVVSLHAKEMRRPIDMDCTYTATF